MRHGGRGTLATYEVVKVGRTGRRRRLTALACGSDDEAIARAALVHPHQSLEVVRGETLVWRFER